MCVDACALRAIAIDQILIKAQHVELFAIAIRICATETNLGREHNATRAQAEKADESDESEKQREREKRNERDGARKHNSSATNDVRCCVTRARARSSLPTNDLEDS